MADRGAGFVNPVIPGQVIGLDYQFNWPGMHHGPAFVLGPKSVSGGPGGFVMDLALGETSEPGPGGGGRGARPMVVIALPGGRTVQVPG